MTSAGMARLVCVASVAPPPSTFDAEPQYDIYISDEGMDTLRLARGEVVVVTHSDIAFPGRVAPLPPANPEANPATGPPHVVLSHYLARELFGDAIASAVGTCVAIGRGVPAAALPVPDRVFIQEIPSDSNIQPFLLHQVRGGSGLLSLLAGEDPTSALSSTLMSTLLYGSIVLPGITLTVHWFHSPLRIRVLAVEGTDGSPARIGASTVIVVSPPPPPSPSPTWATTASASCPGMTGAVEEAIVCLTSRKGAGVLLTGPPGVGKSHVLRHIAASSGLPVHTLRSVDLIDGVTGASLRRLTAFWSVALASPCIVLLDDVQELAPAQPRIAFQRRAVHCLLDAVDTIRDRSRTVFVIASAPSSLDVHAGLLTPGRLQVCVPLVPPSLPQREELLHALWPASVPAAAIVPKLAAATAGYVAGDLQALVREVCVFIWSKGLQDDTLPVALAAVAPRNAFASESNIPPEAALGDLKGMDSAIATLRACVGMAASAAHTQRLRRAGLAPPLGALIHGPPGVGKTALAHAVANEFKGAMTAISVKCSDLISSLVGDTEKAIAQLFLSARANSPCIIIFDQIDVLAPRRRASGGSSHVLDRLLSVLLVEMDGIGAGTDKPVFVLATTCDKEALDPAIIRPGRLDQHVEIRLPDVTARTAVAAHYLIRLALAQQDDATPFTLSFGGVTTSLTPLSSVPVVDVFAQRLADMTPGWSCAALEDVCREAGMRALRRDLTAGTVTWADIAEARGGASGALAGLRL